LSNWQTKDGESTSQNVRSFKFRLLIEAYISLLAETKNTDQIEQSFYLASALQDKIIGKAVALSAARMEVGDPELLELMRQQQDLEMKLSALKNRLANALYAPPELVNKQVIEELQTQVTTLNSAVKTLGEAVRNRFPEYSNIVNPDIVDLATVRNNLDENESFISILSGRDHTFVWAVSKTGPVVMVKAPISKEKMANIVGKLRKALNPGDAYTVLEIPSFDLDLAYRLYEMTLKPVEAGWKQAKNLLVVAQGPIGQIPLSILPIEPDIKTDTDKQIFSNYRDVKWLIKKHAVTVLPSTSAFVSLRSISGKKTAIHNFAGFGDPYFNMEQLEQAENETKQGNTLLTKRGGPIQVRGIRVTESGQIDKKKISSINISMLNRLPDTKEEVLSIASTLKADPDRDVFTGKQASEQTVKSMDLSDRKVVIFATHGLLAGDLDGLDQPALALSAPEVTGNKDNDGLLTMGEIMGLRLNADWVVLSACNTGAGEGAGAEAVSGLGQAFFYAGARSLLVTGWPVETVSAKILTTDLFQRQLDNPDIDRAEALRLTMNAMIAKNHSQGFSYAHPIFWAPFAIVGDGRR
jgi:CHAT domain-containing protein